MQSVEKNNSRLLNVIGVIFRYLFMIIIGVVFGMIVYMWNAKAVMGDMLPRPFGYGASVVLTGSMEPTLQPDDLLIIKDLEDAEYQVGDIVVYQEEKHLVVHRIIEISEESVITQGDANNIADAPVSFEQIKGVVVKKIPGVGKVVSLVQSPIGILIFAGCLFLLLRTDGKGKTEKKVKEQEVNEKERLKLEIELLKTEMEKEADDKDGRKETEQKADRPV